jgi:hypothetical protein
VRSEKARPSISCSSLEEFFTTYLQGIPTDIDEVDTVYSYVATFFQILRQFLNRFDTYDHDPDPDKPEEYIWGWYREDWFRAHVYKTS